MVSWPEDKDLDDEPFEVQLRGWNEDDTFPHKITFRFALLPLGRKVEAQEAAGLLKRIGAAIFGGS